MHDRNGTELKKGDIVTMELVVKELQPTGDPDYCNVNVEAVKSGTVNGNTPMISSMATCTKFLTLTKRLAVILLCGLLVAGCGVGCAKMPAGITASLYSAELTLKTTGAEAAAKAIPPWAVPAGETPDVAVVRLNKANDLLLRTMAQADKNLLSVVAWSRGVDPNTLGGK